MERKVNKLEHSHFEVIVTVDEKTWKDAQNKSFKKVASTVSIPGFRPGKAPESMIKAKVDNVKVMDDAINSLLPTIYKDILDNEDIHPLTQPKVDVTKLSDKELEVKFLIVGEPEVKLGAYKGLAIGKTEAEVSKKDVDEAIDKLLKDNASLIVKDGAAEKGDTVLIDFLGTVDGVPFDGGKAENYDLELGSNSFIPGFEDQLVGTKAGESKDVKVKFPDNYTPELKGKDAVFACTVHEVKAKKLPTLDDTFVKELNLPNIATVEDLKNSKTEEIKKQKTDAARKEYIGKLIDKIAADSKIDMPDEIIEDQVASRKADVTKRMEQSGLNLEQYLSIVGQKEEEFMAKLKEDSIKDMTTYLIMNEVGAKEKITMDNNELEFELAKLADQYKMKIDDVKKALGNNIEQYRYNARMTKIEDFLYQNND